MTLQQIYSLIISYVTSVLPALISSSTASVYNNFATIISQVIYSVQLEIQGAQMSITTATTNNRFGKPEWYVAYSLAFQTGYNVSINTTNPVGFLPFYETIDPNAQIIAQASFQTTNNTITIDGVDYVYPVCTLTVAATDSITGFLIPLTTMQLDEFKSYIGSLQNEITGNVEIPGIPLLVNSSPPNVIGFSRINAYYNGQYDVTILMSNINAAMIEFIKQTTLGAVFRTNLLEQYIISNVPGIVDFAVQQPTILNNGIYVPIEDYTDLTSGYFNFFSGYESQIYPQAV